jgi:hypothetical protein
MSKCIEETCKNPFSKEVCLNTNIKLYIQLKVTKKDKTVEATNYPICEECWVKIAKSNKEWGSSPRVYPTHGLTEKDMESLTVIDTMTIGKCKPNKNEPTEEDDAY